MAAPGALAIVQLDDGWAELKSTLIDPVAALVASTADVSELGMYSCCPGKLWMSTYSLVHNMCAQQSPNNFCEQLYERYIGTLRAFIGAHKEFLIDDLGASLKSCIVFATMMNRGFSYVDRSLQSTKQHQTLQTVTLQEFRAAIDDAYGSREAADAAVSACTTLRDKDRNRLIASQSSTTPLSAEVLECTRLDIVIRIEVKLADLCLKQLRIALASEVKSKSDAEQRASLNEQLRAVNGALVGKLTLNELHEQWQEWDSKYVSTLWSAFNNDAISCNIQTTDDGPVADAVSGKH
jgi:hypothetical protein